MKVLHINKFDSTGGAALAAVRLLQAQRAYGIDAHMLVLQKQSDSQYITPIFKSIKGQIFQNLKFISEILWFTRYEKDRQNRFTFSPARFGFNLHKHPLVKNADILHIHWINQGFISLPGLQKLTTLGKPIVWTLHDLWPVTGGCHYPGNCDNFTSGCGHCPLLKKPGKNDLSAIQNKRKEDIYSKGTIAFVGCSQWIKNEAEKNSLTKLLNPPFYQIFNPIDLNLYCPAPKDEVRRQLGLPRDKNLLLLGAANIFDPRKGTQYLIKALKNLATQHPKLLKEIELITFGKNTNIFQEKLAFPIHDLGLVKDEVKMAQLYQASDLFILSSLQDNLPNTVVESLACGTPVVAFNIGGVPEMIHHKNNGYLAQSGQWDKLSEGILYVLKNHEQLSTNARKFAKNNFAPHIIARKYNEIYRSFH